MHFDQHKEAAKNCVSLLPPKMEDGLLAVKGRAKQISQDRIVVIEGSGDMQGKVPLIGDPTRFALVNLGKVGDST